MLSIHTPFDLLPISIPELGEENWRNIVVAINGIEQFDLFMFRPYNILNKTILSQYLNGRLLQYNRLVETSKQERS